MEKLKLYNTLTREKQEFISIKNGFVGLYTCGPTVYNYAHIGNLRTYIFEDILKRVLMYNSYKIKHVMNITDVGHLTGDRDMGEDKLEKSANLEKKSAWDIAKFYTNEFKKNLKDLNIIEPNVWCKATDNIKEQIKLVQILEKKGFTYKTNDGIYFDTSRFPDYNKLSHQKLENLQEGARVEKNDEKRNPTDFALWKFSPKNEKRQMEWKSPWGVGFPGWHAECSAMSMKYLGKYLDIHCGGIDHVNIHHTNEIAQSESTTGKPFFNFWIHGEFLNISNGEKMAKSEGNFLRLQSLIDKGINPLAFRYLCLMTHYRKPLNFFWGALEAAQNGLNSLENSIRDLGTFKGNINKEYKNKFLEVVNNDLNTPQAISVLQEVLKSKLENKDKLATILDFDKVLGLHLENIEQFRANAEIEDLAKERQKARQEKDWNKADEIRKKIENLGWEIEDWERGYILKEKK